MQTMNMIDIFKNIRHLTETDEDILFFVNALIEQNEKDIPLIDRYIDDINLVELKRVTHKVKSTFKHLNISPITEYIVSLDEENQPNCSIDLLTYHHRKFKEELVYFMEAVHAERDKIM